MNDDIMKMQIFHKLKYDLKGKYKLHKVILKFQNHLFLRYVICLKRNLFKTFQECQHYEDIFV